MKILITGATGYLGQRLVERLYLDNDIRVVSRNEGKLIALKQKFPEIEIIPGDIACHHIAHKACFGVDAVFHCAAFKHVTMAESDVCECVNTNITGTLNILQESIGCDYVVTTSTDKAAQVSGIYGATKLITEGLFKEFGECYPITKYRVVRYGNVLDSTGSVSNIWRDRIKVGKPVKISDPNATRFFWTRDEAVDLLFDCLENATDATPYVPEMKSMSMGSLLQAMTKKYSNGQKIDIVETGLQPSENLHEIIVEGQPDSGEAEKYTIEEIKDMI